MTPGDADREVDTAERRAVADWQTVYTDAARQRQRYEAIYLGALLILAGPIGLFLVWSGSLGEWLGLNAGQTRTFETYAFAWLGSLLGGAVFGMKWLYHSVAKGIWHQDRFIWRMASPHLSAGFAFGLITLATSGIIVLIDVDVLRRPGAMIGVAFLLGHFSDLTVARLARTVHEILRVKPDDVENHSDPATR